MSRTIMGKKIGMTMRFDKLGKVVPCTVIEVEPSIVVRKKEVSKDGYEAIVLATGKVQTKDPRTKERRVSKPRLGVFKRASVEPRRYLYEARGKVEGIEIGSSIGLEELESCAYLDVIGISKGKGFQGVMRRYNFRGGPAAHGSGFHRHGGSTGMRSTPGRCFPGRKKAGRMGGEQVNVQSLRVIELDAKKGILLLQGAVPGAPGGQVYLTRSIKKK